MDVEVEDPGHNYYVPLFFMIGITLVFFGIVVTVSPETPSNVSGGELEEGQGQSRDKEGQWKSRDEGEGQWKSRDKEGLWKSRDEGEGT